MKVKILFAALMLFILVNCTKDTYNTSPDLKFESVNGSVFPQQSQIAFTLQFTDKEGDISDTIWVQRVSKVTACGYLSYTDSFPIPSFNAGHNVKGEFVFNYGYATQTPPNIGACTAGISTTDTSYFRFWMHDKAQHVSDTVQSPDLVLLKQ